MGAMFTPAAGQGSAVADLSAQVASLLRRVKQLEEEVTRVETQLDRALAIAIPGWTPETPSSGTESGGTK